MGSPKDHAKEVVGSAHETGRFVFTAEHAENAEVVLGGHLPQWSLRTRRSLR